MDVCPAHAGVGGGAPPATVEMVKSWPARFAAQNVTASQSWRLKTGTLMAVPPNASSAPFLRFSDLF
jgi:hypothetical protein